MDLSLRNEGPRPISGPSRSSNDSREKPRIPRTGSPSSASTAASTMSVKAPATREECRNTKGGTSRSGGTGERIGQSPYHDGLPRDRVALLRAAWMYASCPLLEVMPVASRTARCGQAGFSRAVRTIRGLRVRVNVGQHVYSELAPHHCNPPSPPPPQLFWP